jgi:prepilin-type N-terminal cleavage/methylation domain-containing protein
MGRRGRMASKNVSLHKNRRGFVLIELMIALILSGFVMTMVFYSWKYISDHTIMQQRKALFQAEAERIAQLIVLQIRKSPEVVRTAHSSIAFLSPTGLDTIVYEFMNGSFRKNGLELWSSDRDARITQFSIETEHAGLMTDSSNFVTLLLTVGLKDRFGNSSTLPLKVRAALSPDRFTTETGGGSRGWNF